MFMKKNKIKFTRYVCKSELDMFLVELSFNGGIDVGKGNPNNTDVIVRCLSKYNIHCSDSPWHVIWKLKLGNIEMPTGAWNGISLVEIINESVYIASSNCILNLEIDSGKILWTTDTGNTPIYKLMPSHNNDALIVYNGGYNFKNEDNKANIVKLSLSGDIIWRSETPSKNDIFANMPYYKNGKLYSSSWECYLCQIDDDNGTILEKKFTK